MEKRYRKAWMLVIVGVAALFTACSSDEEANEWNATYVYLERADHLITSKSYALTHGASGISGDEVTTTFSAKVQKPASSDITVDLSTTLGETYADKVALSKKQVTIKAGQTSSEEITATIGDWSFLQENRAPVALDWTIAVGSIQTKAGNVRISSNLRVLKLPITKTAFINVAFGQPEEGALAADRSAWTMAVEEGTRGGAATRLIDGSTSTDIARDGGKGFWITADFGQPLTLTGVYARFWGTYYSATEVELYVSEDGRNWESQSAVRTSGSVQSIKFLQPVTARYLKYNMNKIYYNTVSITEFNVYAK
ncbi:MAG: DUF4989 domain-containing protein [Bacteroidia bacterium]|nr:DUF4989 domain-containing protein [Bacteroidia bacterium]